MAKVQQVRQENPQAEVQLWSEDEARFGLQPVIRQRWAKIGERPCAEVNPRYEWTWSYGAVEMASGKSFFLLLPDLSGSSVEIFLREFAASQGLGAEKIAILLWDGAPAHRAQVRIPKGIELVRIPPHTPELNPSERLWSPFRGTVANRTFNGIDELEEVLIARMKTLADQRDYLSSLTNYYWLPSSKSQ